jgi:ribosome-binding factor A
MKPDRHTLQLCSQIAETLHMVFLDQTDDDLRDLTVIEVIPLAGAATLLVRVAYPVSKADDLARVQAKLTSSVKMLRAEVAGSITRRKVPELFFQVTAAAAGYSP